MEEKINEIMDVMNSISYGFLDDDGHNILDTNPLKWEEEIYLQTPEELLKSRCGVCWDQVELERYLFELHKIPCKTYFIYFSENDMIPSHTFLTFQDNDHYYWFEHSWNSFQGIHKFSSEKELLKEVIHQFRCQHSEISSHSPFYLYEYLKPKEHISCNDFYKYVETQKQIKSDCIS